MTDPKAAAAYHSSEAPVTRLDLDAIRSRAAESKAAHDDYMTVSPGDRRRADRDSARDVPVLLVALAAERARADQAWRAAIERAQDELVRQDCFSDRTLRILDAVRDESAAPTAEPGAAS